MEVESAAEDPSSVQMATAAATTGSGTDALAIQSYGISGTKRSKISNAHPFIEPAANRTAPQPDLDLWGDCPSSTELAARGLEDRAAAATVESPCLDKFNNGKTSWALTGLSHLSTACAKHKHVRANKSTRMDTEF